MRDRLQAILGKKDQRSFDGGKYRDVVLLVHTDEFHLDAEALASGLQKEVFAVRHGNLNRAFLLFSYDPKRQLYPFVELRLAA